MSLTLIGLGLELGDISVKAVSCAKEASFCFLENFTTDSFNINSVSEFLNRKVTLLTRNQVESDYLLDLSKASSVVLLVPGDPLIATTHYELIERARTMSISAEIIHAPSIIHAILRTGVNPYKFGRIVSLPELQTPYPDSPFGFISKNQTIGCHTLLLMDPSLSGDSVFTILKNHFPKIKILAMESLGTKNERIFCIDLNDFRSIKPEMKHPFSIVLLSRLDHKEEEYLARWKK